MVRLLLEKGADPNKKTNYGDSPLFYAVRKLGFEEIAKKLIEAGAKGTEN